MAKSIAPSALKNRLNDFALIFLVSIIVMGYQFLTSRFASCVEDDSIMHMILIRQFADSLREGVFIPRWLPHIYGGYGSPVFIFSSPLVYYLAAFPFGVTGSLTLAVKIIRLVGMIGSGLAFLHCARSLNCDKSDKLIAIVGILIPYHVFHSYWFSFVAETGAWAWFVLLLSYLIRFVQCRFDRSDSIIFALIYAALILTHLVSAYIATVIVITTLIFYSFKKSHRQFAKLLLRGFILGLCASAYFLFPALYEQRYVHPEALSGNFLQNYKDNFLFFPSLEWSRTIGHAQFVPRLQLMVILQGVAVLIVFFRRQLFFQSGDLKSKGWNYVFILWGMSLFMTIRISLPFWQIFPGMANVQFTFRWLILNSIATSCIVGQSLYVMIHKRTTLLTADKIFIIIGIVLFIQSVIIIPQCCYKDYEHSPHCQSMTLNVPAFAPRALANWEDTIQFPFQQSIKPVCGEVVLREVVVKANIKIIRLSAIKPSVVNLMVAYYPGWIIMIDGKESAFQLHEGVMAVALEPGPHLIVMEFGSTWWRLLSGTISLMTLGYICMLKYKVSRKHIYA